MIGPNSTRVFEKTLIVTIPPIDSKHEPPMVLPIFAEDVVIDGPAGAYRFLATFERGAAAAGRSLPKERGKVRRSKPAPRSSWLGQLLPLEAARRRFAN